MNTQENSAHSLQSKEELRKEFDELILVCRTNNGRPDWALIQDNFDWFYSKLSQKEQEIDRLKKQLEELRK